MKQLAILGTIIIIVDFLGFYLAYLYGRKTKNFHWNEYIVIIILPLIGVFVFAYLIDIKILVLFIISSFAGFIFEYILGFTYHKTLNKRLWTYNRLSINGYTSLLSIPFWGIAGVAFWFFSKIIGL